MSKLYEAYEDIANVKKDKEDIYLTEPIKKLTFLYYSDAQAFKKEMRAKGYNAQLIQCAGIAEPAQPYFEVIVSKL